MLYTIRTIIKLFNMHQTKEGSLSIETKVNSIKILDDQLLYLEDNHENISL